MKMPTDCVVVGAGQAGLGVSRRLQERGVDHLVLEQGRIGDTWRTQRWESFRVNTPNRMNGLPGLDYDGDPDAFPSATELADSFERYAAKFQLPVRTGVTVTSVKEGAGGFEIGTDAPDLSVIPARSVVIASGPMRRARIPAVAGSFPPGAAQLHAGEYRNPEDLPAGAVLVVGTAQSGCQIAEDLLGAGRRVYLSCSSVTRTRRRYRGRDITGWLSDVGFLDMRPADLPDPAMLRAAWPQVSGLGKRGHTVSLQWLSGLGAILVGRLSAVSNGIVTFEDTVADAIQAADAGSVMIKGLIEAHIARTGMEAGPLESDAADEPCTDPEALRGPLELDLTAAGVGSVVWCTGFDAGLSWIHLPVVDRDGAAIHNDGASPVPGLFFVGLPWMRMRRSSIIAGVDPDSAFIAEAVAAHLAG